MSQLKTLKPVKRAIKEAILERLINRTSAAGKVFISRSIPVKEDELPCILIYSSSEAVEQSDEAPKSYKRRLSIAIECLDMGDTDNDLDVRTEELADEIEVLLEMDETLGKLVNRLTLAGADYQQEPDGQSPMGSIVLRYVVEWYQDAMKAGSTCEDDLNGLDIKWQVGHDNESSDAVIDAVDNLPIEQGD